LWLDAADTPTTLSPVDCVAAGLVNDGGTRSDKMPLLTWRNILEYKRVLVRIITGWHSLFLPSHKSGCSVLIKTLLLVEELDRPRMVLTF
jgi:hypothetical protein